MRFVSALLAAASLVATVKGHWLGDIPRKRTYTQVDPFAVADCSIDQGFAPFGGANYPVFRNVKDYGARGEFLADLVGVGIEERAYD
jgi:glucan 1,3-beta-glucosidase